MTFVYYKQPAWAPRWRGGRVPRKLKKTFHKNLLEPMSFREGYTYPGHPEYEPLVITSDEMMVMTNICWVDTHVGKRIGGRWKPRHYWSETRRAR